jgi:hypothetical protein
LRQFLSLSEDGYLPTNGISSGEIPTTKGPPEGIESFGPGGEVPEASFELSDGGKGDARGGGHRGLGETTPFAEFTELNSKTILERFLCHDGTKCAGKETLYLSFLHLKSIHWVGNLGHA